MESAYIYEQGLVTMFFEKLFEMFYVQWLHYTNSIL